MANMRAVYLFAWCLVYAVCISQVYSSSIICEHSSMYLSCPEDQVLEIGTAIYGRTRKDICPHRDNKRTDCKSKTSTETVKKLCQGKQLCHLIAKNNILGNPCGDTHKYLEVTYECIW
ncbi:hypothetical protein DPMN_165002 [Dreissena polymorpha]|uniref:SUEL-type lectin domain-containing protein n=1 Tax=Dreissena polymorpha TaxID=45954 RepID=A0A9D4EZS7_DREPO|nr:hypothetical protein DPMN_165002 [Dreissena polymorpha]